MREHAVAPIHTTVVAIRLVGPRDATSVPLSILTWLVSNLSSLLGLCRVLSTATEKMASRGPGGGNEPLVAGTEAAKSGQEVLAIGSLTCHLIAYLLRCSRLPPTPVLLDNRTS